ncbi:leucine-rich repeat domain-containing protein [Jannaschia formosa]|uniref:leucine-rich repeat domain-containing protein n=1 Tax=Jannaschia formosa TaxID=2259592 RepID=UPI000E1BC0E7|nr:hypothetical protein [Jannaschia formosa]TFL16865.1 hypothetical protein DR046_17835 [Jannaschia formosa]
MANEDWDEAVRRVRAARENGEDRLDLSGLQIDSLPPEIADLTNLQLLDLNGTRINDAGLRRITGLTALQILVLDNTQITDAGLSHIANLTALGYLVLNNTQITDAGLSHIAGLTALRHLDLANTHIADRGLFHIAGLTTLQGLYLNNTQITDLGLPHLADLASLLSIDLDSTRVTDAGLPHIEGHTVLQHLGLANTQTTDAGLPHISGLTDLRHLDLANTQISDAGLLSIEGLTALRHLVLDNTLITDAGLPRIAGLTALENLYINDTRITDLRPLLDLLLLTKGPWDVVDRIRLNNIPALSDPGIASAIAHDDYEAQRKALLAHLRSLPPWPEPIGSSTSQKQGQAASVPRTFTPLTVAAARDLLENDYPLVRDRCQHTMAILAEGLSYHRIRIPNDEDALADHRQVEQALVYARALAASVHDSLPADFTDRPLTDAEVDRFKSAFNEALIKIEQAARFIDRPDHSPTMGGLMRLGVASAVGGLVALVPGVAAAATIPAVYAALYGKEGAKAVIGAFKGGEVVGKPGTDTSGGD